MYVLLLSAACEFESRRFKVRMPCAIAHGQAQLRMGYAQLRIPMMIERWFRRAWVATISINLAIKHHRSEWYFHHPDAEFATYCDKFGRTSTGSTLCGLIWCLIQKMIDFEDRFQVQKIRSKRFQIGFIYLQENKSVSCIPQRVNLQNKLLMSSGVNQTFPVSHSDAIRF